MHWGELDRACDKRGAQKGRSARPGGSLVRGTYIEYVSGKKG